MLLDAGLVRSLERLSIAARRTLWGQAQGERKVNSAGASIEFHDYRQYQPGDDLRYLDWQVYGRLDRLVLRLYRDEVDLLVQILVDASGSMAVGDPPKSDYALRLAAALGYVGLAGLERVAVGYVAAGRADVTRPFRGRGSFGPLADYLERIEFGGATALNASLRAEAVRLPRRSRLILVTDLLDRAGYQDGLLALQASGHDVFVIHLLSPDEIDPPEIGDVRLIDAETGSAEDVTLSRDRIAGYRERTARHYAEVEAFAYAHGIGYVRVSTATPLEDVLFRNLTQGRLLR
ncbi:MAG TPA: DUF58 domain-containing protein [Thermodesulfobacteriota bacterium]